MRIGRWIGLAILATGAGFLVTALIQNISSGHGNPSSTFISIGGLLVLMLIFYMKFWRRNKRD